MLEVEPHTRVSKVGAGTGSIVCQAHRYTSRGHFLAGFALLFIQDSGNRDKGGRSAPDLLFRSGISSLVESTPPVGHGASGRCGAPLSCCGGRLLDCLDAAGLGVDQCHLGLLDEKQQRAGWRTDRSSTWRIA